MRLFEFITIDIPRSKMPQVSVDDLIDHYKIEKTEMSLTDIIPVQQERVPGLTKKTMKKIKSGTFDRPILVDRNNRIVNGHHRYDAYKLLGYQKAEVVKVLDATVWDLIDEYSHTRDIKSFH
jgi:hypothetical protein